jgi:Periplasmic binding protein
MDMKTFVLLAAAAVILAGTGAQGQEKLKIGIIATLSGPPAVLGQQLRNGFNLAVKDLNGKFGGRDVEVIVADDELKPDLAVNKAKTLVVARRQQARSLELRAAMSMARYWRDRSKPQRARELLAPAYDWFTEGFETLDLKEAKALLTSLAS